jgi:hypothetical protein
MSPAPLVVSLLTATLLWAAAPPAGGASPAGLPRGLPADPVAATLDVEVAVESAQLAADLADHASLRQREQQELRRVLDLAARIDRRLLEDPPATLELARLEDDLAAARAGANATGERTREVRRRVYDRWQRVRLLQQARDERTGPPPIIDPLSGRWILLLMPSGQRGWMELRLDGTLVQGSYELDGGFHGSLRGTFVAGKVTLERIDSERGFDAILESRLDARTGTLAGAWRTTLLDGSNYGGGDWTASRPTENAE